jgi:hypothetical protein
MIIVDINYYPIPEARNSNMRHRPIGIYKPVYDTYLKTVFAELQSKINFLARNKIYIAKIYNDTRNTNI